MLICSQPRCGFVGNREEVANLQSQRNNVQRDVADCLREDRRRGEPGSSNSKGPAKDDKLKRIRLRPLVDDSVVKSRIETVQSKSKLVKVTGLDSNTAEVMEALGEMFGGSLS